jgi:hypothetical protein
MRTLNTYLGKPRKDKKPRRNKLTEEEKYYRKKGYPRDYVKMMEKESVNMSQQSDNGIFEMPTDEEINLQKARKFYSNTTIPDNVGKRNKNVIQYLETGKWPKKSKK